jgi:hypothetical protein
MRCFDAEMRDRILCVFLAIVVAVAGADVARAATPSSSALLTRFQPVTVLHPDELFRPVTVNPFLGTTQLEQRLTDGSWSAVSEQPQGVLPTADPSGCSSAAGSACWRLNVPVCTPGLGLEALPCYQAAEQTRPESNAVYGAALRVRGEIVLEYWYWYWYDFWSGTFPPSDYVWQAHEGDWEVVTVLLTAAGRPLSVGYSQHSCGKVRSWAKVPRWRGTNHPVVFVALGTHANYFTAGALHLDLRPQCYPAAGAAVLRHYLSQVLDYTGHGRAVGPALRGVIRSRLIVVSAHSPQWMNFPGYWGEINLFHAPDPIGTRVAGPAPVGPRFHDIWTDPGATLRRWPRG